MKHLFLLVDDEPQSAMVLAKLLKSAHFDILMATSIPQARAMLERFLPHALVVDINLSSQMNGLQWIETLRDGPFADIPAVVLSSSTSPVSVSQAIDLRVLDYIIKPSNCSVLAQKINRLCKNLEESSIYSCRLGPNTSAGAVLRLPGIISAISDSRMAIEGAFRRKSGPEGCERLISYDTDFFQHMGLAKPSLKFAFAEPISEHRYRNHFAIVGWDESERRRLRRWFWHKRLRPVSNDSLYDLSAWNQGIHLDESVRMLALEERGVEFALETLPEANSLAELRIGEIELPLLLQEPWVPDQGEVRTRASVDPRIQTESARKLRQLILGFKTGANASTETNASRS